MEVKPIVVWLRQTPLLALAGAIGLLIAVWGIAQQGLDLWKSGLAPWVSQLVGLLIFATFLVLLAFKRDQDLNGRLQLLEARLSPEDGGSAVDRLDAKVQSLIMRGMQADDRTGTFMWPEMEAVLLTISQRFGLPPVAIYDGAGETATVKGAGYLMAIWPYLQEGHIEKAKEYADRMNSVLEDERKSEKGDTVPSPTDLSDPRAS